MNRRRLRTALWAAAAVPVVLLMSSVGFYCWASRGFDPTDPLDVPPERYGEPPETDRPLERLRVVTWNIAYGRGRKDDAGDLRSERVVRDNLHGIARLIRSLDADLVALQEVDFDSARTHRIDQLALLAREAGYPYAARVETWRCRYVPYPYWPPSQHYGRMASGQAVLSRFPIRSNVRRLLPQPDQPFWYNAFYLHRSLQFVEVDLPGGAALDLVNVHLEAFHQGNRERQAAILGERLAERPAGRLRIVLGDFNAIPPEATLRHRFPDEPETDMRTDRTIERVRALGLPEALPAATAESETLTFPADLPNRRLDYLFLSPAFRASGGRVVREAGELSDHLPVVVDLALP